MALGSKYLPGVNMIINPRKSVAIAILAVLAGCLASGISYGRSLTDVNHARRIAQAPSFKIGSSVPNPQTLEIHDLETLFRKTTGKVSAKAVLDYADNFEAYWQASRSSRSGKAFEAYEVYRTNRRLQRLKSSDRFVITAVEGNPQHAADIVLIDKYGRVKKQFQFKAGYTGALKAIKEPKYAEMTIVTPRDKLKIIYKELEKVRSKAKVRGRPLSPFWQKVEQALADGRLTDEMLPGYKTRTIEQIERAAKIFTAKLFQTASKAMPKTSAVVASSTRGALSVGSRCGSASFKIAGKAFAVADFAFIGYQTYSDFHRYVGGEMGGGSLAAKATFRVGEASIAVFLLLSPDPGTKLILGTIAASMILSGADVSLDAFNDAKRERTQRLLKSIDREEQFYATRHQLSEEIKSLRFPDNPGSR